MAAKKKMELESTKIVFDHQAESLAEAIGMDEDRMEKAIAEISMVLAKGFSKKKSELVEEIMSMPARYQAAFIALQLGILEKQMMSDIGPLLQKLESEMARRGLAPADRNPKSKDDGDDKRPTYFG